MSAILRRFIARGSTTPMNLFERGLAPVIITTGGAGKDPRYSEGQVGRDYLESRGVPDVNLIAETQGDNTEESVQRVTDHPARQRHAQRACWSAMPITCTAPNK